MGIGKSDRKLAKRFPETCEKAVEPLLKNARHEGTVVRWSAAFALGEILKLRTGINAQLIPQIQTLSAAEEKNSIRKIFEKALKAISS